MGPIEKINNLIKKLNAFELFMSNIVKSVISENRDDIVQQIRDQLWNGKNGDDENISPSYSEDNFFKTREAAVKYVKWKTKITHNSKRDPDSPNLYINGKFHKSLYADVRDHDMEIKSNWSEGENKIIPKYGKNTFALQDEYIKSVIRLQITDLINIEIKKL